ncbi:3-hydroxyacyl-CoA dehydrogenase PaaH [Marinobacterium sedimentorum]|uniref:3-hydroxyacyl-CoA dehydrogenase PaaH n=1 Tax=Marinobacterium sedimentorum TaxID=2927804 RepID=UPI0020C6F0B7|nr:3-hydroxyacyl-CoA dehydrogenase PaaH [Marinobacterium sedimentorum]MCP8686560.1 3-hydroxyacyl-CoA dehydrogenase PaaC [Marinobacterium sedimentorum]
MNALNTGHTVAVIGAGAMGAGIAQVAASAGHPVMIYDKAPGAAQAGIAGIAKGLDRQVERGKLDSTQRNAILARLSPISDLKDLAPAALVIEAIVENLAIKQQVLTQVEAICSTDCILASNTSSISITSIAAGLQRPQNLAGLHFFNPAPVMKLVEVISGLDTDPAITDCLLATAGAWGKQAVQAKSTPGFIVNRLARPFYAEGLRLLDEGAADSATLDALMRDAGGFRMGPFELMDLIGHDVNYAVTRSVFDAYYGDDRFTPSLTQQALVEGGRLGRKSGRGFYDYAADAPRAEPARLSAGTQAVVDSIVVEGSLGPADGLIARLQECGIKVIRRDGPGLIRIADSVLMLSDGRMATERAAIESIHNLVLFDLALDYSRCSRIAISLSDQADSSALAPVVALLSAAGIEVSLLDDAPGLAVLRTVAMLANEACDAVLQGVCSARDADTAMQFGVNYPAGPLAWAEQVGLGYIHRTLTHLQQSYGETRYRPSALLRRKAFSGESIHD